MGFNFLFALRSFLKGCYSTGDKVSGGKLYDQSEIPGYLRLFSVLKLLLQGADQRALTQTMNAKVLGSCMKYVSSKYNNQLTCSCSLYGPDSLIQLKLGSRTWSPWQPTDSTLRPRQECSVCDAPAARI
jgi:hypothetical protein